MVSKAKTKKTLKQFTPQRANIVSTGGVPLELPNHSRGKAPEADRGLVNKEYVDAQIAGVTTTGVTGRWTNPDDDVVIVEDGLITFISFKILLEDGEKMLLETGDEVLSG